MKVGIEKRVEKKLGVDAVGGGDWLEFFQAVRNDARTGENTSKEFLAENAQEFETQVDKLLGKKGE